MFHLYTGSGVVFLCEICEKIPFLKIAGIMLKFLGYYCTEITMISKDVLVLFFKFYMKLNLEQKDVLGEKSNLLRLYITKYNRKYPEIPR